MPWGKLKGAQKLICVANHEVSTLQGKFCEGPWVWVHIDHSPALALLRINVPPVLPFFVQKDQNKTRLIYLT